MSLTPKDILVLVIVFIVCDLIATYLKAFIDEWRKDRARERANASTDCKMKHPRLRVWCDIKAGHMGQHQGVDPWNSERVFWDLNRQGIDPELGQ